MRPFFISLNLNSNHFLYKAKVKKRDEFYTRYSDIEEEMIYYRDHFRNKTVFCNCNDGLESNFYKYFRDNFTELGLKKLICTSYSENPYKIELENNRKLIQEIKSGDFKDTLELLDEADIVVTNPPFSEFNEFMKTLLNFGKEFIVMGNFNALVWRDIFPYVVENKIRLGATLRNRGTVFDVPEEYGEVGNETKLGFVRWFTNLDINCQIPSLALSKEYIEGEYEYFDKYPAINVNRLKDIPVDYAGEMGVPITYLDKHNPDDFELIGKIKEGTNRLYDFARPFVNGKVKYGRLLIRNKHL